jgi:hypothetical protein
VQNPNTYARAGREILVPFIKPGLQIEYLGCGLLGSYENTSEKMFYVDA